MTPEEIQAVYDTLTPQIEEQAANDAAIIGNSQRSIGPMAAAVASPENQTFGLANYTYNRLMRPVVDSTRDHFIVQGRAAMLNRDLTLKLQEAQRNYERAKNAGIANSGNNKYNEKTDPAFDGTQLPEADGPIDPIKDFTENQLAPAAHGAVENAADPFAPGYNATVWVGQGPFGRWVTYNPATEKIIQTPMGVSLVVPIDYIGN